MTLTLKQPYLLFSAEVLYTISVSYVLLKRFKRVYLSLTKLHI